VTNIYYVYAYLREDQTPYYIGKGKGKRAWERWSHNYRGIQLPKDPNNVIILESGLEEQIALDIESQLILYYGRKDLGTGILYNKTDGGPNPVLYGAQNGMTGKHHTEDTLERISQSLRAKKHSKFCPYCNQYKSPMGFHNHLRSHTGKNPARA